MPGTAGGRGPLPPPRRVPRVLREFLQTETAAGVALLVAVVVALLWANSPWDRSYHAVWTTQMELRVGGYVVGEDLRHWVNEALMAVFFFVVGLEIKRELVAGELRRWRTAALPVVAALGGMVVPACLYLLVNLGGGGGGARGWAIPMATDIALSLGVVALLGRRVPSSARLFLLTLAIVDDIVAIVVIAVFYSSGVEWPPLAAAAVLLVAIGVLQKLRVFWLALFAVLALAVWFFTYRSGLHATLAGVALGLLAPARAPAASQVVRRWKQDLVDEPSSTETRAMTRLAESGLSVAERLQHALHPFSAFLVVPLFALANAGVSLRAPDFDAPGARTVALGVFLGLVVGKFLGVTGFTLLAVRWRLASLPSGMRPQHLVGLAGVAGIGFTVSLFITGLAFERAELAEASTLAIMGASVVAALVGGAVLGRASR